MSAVSCHAIGDRLGVRILYISSRLNADDGSSVHGREFVRALAEEGHEVVTHPPISGRAPAGRSRPILLRVWNRLTRVARTIDPRLAQLMAIVQGYVTSRKAVNWIRAHVLRKPVDIVVCRGVLYDFTPNLLRRHVTCPMIVEINAIVETEVIAVTGRPPRRLTVWADHKTREPADALAVVSNEIKAHLIARGETRPIAVARNGVDLERFRPDSAARCELRASHGLTDTVTVGYLGSFKRWHGLSDSLRVLERLVAQGLPVRFVAIGSGSDRAKFEAECRSRGLSAHVTVLPGVPHDEVARVLQMIDVALMTYPKIEPFYFSPLKMYEYLACGVPVVASALGQITEVLQSADMGRLVEPEDIDGFTGAVADLVSNHDLRARLGVTARQWAEHNCSWRQNARTVLSAADNVRRS
jgi:glycosyltransferase involved in cell wall biosynthesis